MMQLQIVLGLMVSLPVSLLAFLSTPSTNNGNVHEPKEDLPGRKIEDDPSKLPANGWAQFDFLPSALVLGVVTIAGVVLRVLAARRRYTGGS